MSDNSDQTGASSGTGGKKTAYYRPIPELSPYAGHKRYETRKEVHKFYLAKIRELTDTDAPLRVLDVGCGNGELLYVLKSEIPAWSYKGVDATSAFVEAAKTFPGLAGVEFEVCDIESAQGQYDLVLCTGVLQIFPQVETPLGKLVELTKKGGWIFCDGLFNKWDVEVRMEYCDNSNDVARGLWRVDWNQHSRKTVSAFLKDWVANFKFLDIEMDLDLAPNPNIHTNQFTFRNAEGRNIITNGTNVLLNKTMLIIER
ncbi:MAG: class I SAM-dependent methyltransferase [Alphaproteobacteria bacterium]|nr:class I SAM-dependent methyltransferase [Alphaproteobacteria bacterium]